MALTVNRVLLVAATAVVTVLIALSLVASPALAQGSINITQDTSQVGTSNNGNISQSSSQKLGNVKAEDNGSVSASQINTQDADTNGDIEQVTGQQMGDVTTRGEAGVTQDTYQVGTSGDGKVSQSARQRLGDLRARGEGRLSVSRRNTQEAETQGDIEQNSEQVTGDITAE